MTTTNAVQLFQAAKIHALDVRVTDNGRIEAEIEPYPSDPRTLCNRLYSLGVGVRCVTFIQHLDGGQSLWIRF